MIVGSQQARRIDSGRQTQHRYPRARRALEVGTVVPVSYRVPNSFLGYDRDGNPRTELKRACRVEISSCREDDLADASAADAVAEGYRNLGALRAAWGLGGAERPSKADSVPVWVITFNVVRAEEIRLLVPSSRIVAGRQGDYVHVAARALRDEPEAVDDHWLAEFTAEARSKEWKRERDRRAARGQLGFEEQVAAFSAEARRRHIDIRDELRAIRRWKDPKICNRQLESIRRKLEPVLAG